MNCKLLGRVNVWPGAKVKERVPVIVTEPIEGTLVAIMVVAKLPDPIENGMVAEPGEVMESTPEAEELPLRLPSIVTPKGAVPLGRPAAVRVNPKMVPAQGPECSASQDTVESVTLATFPAKLEVKVSVENGDSPFGTMLKSVIVGVVMILAEAVAANIIEPKKSESFKKLSPPKGAFIVL